MGLRSESIRAQNKCEVQLFDLVSASLLILTFISLGLSALPKQSRHCGGRYRSEPAYGADVEHWLGERSVSLGAISQQYEVVD